MFAKQIRAVIDMQINVTKKCGTLITLRNTKNKIETQKEMIEIISEIFKLKFKQIIQVKREVNPKRAKILRTIISNS